MSDYLFAYGTLRPGFAPEEMAQTVAKLRLVGEGFVYGRLYDLGTCPGAVVDPTSTQKIFGSVFEIPEDQGILRELDAYEEFDSAVEQSPFIRTRVGVETTSGEIVHCWIYVYNQNAAERSSLS